MLCSRARIDGYRAALESAGVDGRPRADPGRQLPPQSVAIAAARELFELAEPPTAIFAGSDEQAFGVAEAARVTGRRIPEDLSIVGFDDLPDLPVGVTRRSRPSASRSRTWAARPRRCCRR